jgi:hypothetical protein
MDEYEAGDEDDAGYEDDAEDRDGVDALDVNIDDKGKVEAGIGRVDHLFQHRFHTHILLISPPSGVHGGQRGERTRPTMTMMSARRRRPRERVQE